jgi:hypothetical protein
LYVILMIFSIYLIFVSDLMFLLWFLCRFWEL